ncbi:MAG: hypothetical protein FD170_590 [Bacteroidetes bacterium]|nr:MAG: hypothetical protein FD170_590 [Bacteroidota bacterium]
MCKYQPRQTSVKQVKQYFVLILLYPENLPKNLFIRSNMQIYLILMNNTNCQKI